MRKLLLLSAIALGAMTANAQNLTVTVGGTPVGNGETVDSYDLVVIEESQELMGQLFEFTVTQLDPKVEVTAAKTGNYSITVSNTTTDTSVANLPKIQFCWPEYCHIIDPGAKDTQSGTLQGGVPTNLAIDSTSGSEFDMPWPEEAFTLSCRVDIVPAGSSTPEFYFFINMHYDPSMLSAVEGIGVEEAAPVYFDLSGRQVANPAQGQLVIERRGAKAVKKIMK